MKSNNKQGVKKIKQHIILQKQIKSFTSNIILL
jgi:hypothetical protein